MHMRRFRLRSALYSHLRFNGFEVKYYMLPIKITRHLSCGIALGSARVVYSYRFHKDNSGIYKIYIDKATTKITASYFQLFPISKKKNSMLYLKYLFLGALNRTLKMQTPI